MIGADPDYYLEKKIGKWSKVGGCFDREALAEYKRCFRDPATIHATCEDYRAAATIDLEHDRADREAGRKIDCPVLLVWARRYLKERGRRHLDVWRTWAEDVREVPLDCGHFVAEEAAEDCAAALTVFLSEE